MKPEVCGLALLVLVLGGSVGADADPARWLGLTPETAYRERGAPAEVYPWEVKDGLWQVVHFYADHSYLFWTTNRVWQVRLDRLWTGSVSGVTMGTPRATVEASLGPPVAKSDSWSVWDLPHQTFPRKLRLVFVDGVLADAYFYRSDL